MSRCFPYPPPGFAGRSASGEALILSIKLQEGEKAKSERKNDRRREKKEKKEKKLHKKHDKTPSAEKLSFTEEKKLNHADDKHQKYSKLQTQSKQSHDQIERSNITEEHGKPCCSSESTENSGKRQRISVLPSTNNGVRSSGTVIRFRVSTQKRDDPPTPSSANDTPCSTSGSDVRVQASALPIPKTASALPTPKTGSATLKLEAPSHPVKETLEPPSSTKEAKLPRPLRKYKALFDSWVPPPLEPETPDEGADWLFSSKKDDVVSQPAAKRLKCCKEEAPISVGPVLQPRARLLHDADIYALPFTVPF